MAGYDGEEQYYAAMKDQLGLTPEDDSRGCEVPAAAGEDRRADRRRQRCRRRCLHRGQPAGVRAAHPTAHFVDLSETEKEANDVLQKLADGEDFALMAKNLLHRRRYRRRRRRSWVLIDEDDPLADANILKRPQKLSVGETTRADNGRPRASGHPN